MLCIFSKHNTATTDTGHIWVQVVVNDEKVLLFLFLYLKSNDIHKILNKIKCTCIHHKSLSF
jgi:hypothetical protein